MIQGVGPIVKIQMQPRTTDQQVEMVQAGYDALKSVVMRAAAGLAARPLIRQETFEAIWAPFRGALVELVV